MDCDMPPRIAFWTSAFEPEIEAISSEVELLRRNYPLSIAWGLSHRHWCLLSRRRGWCLHPRLHLPFRGVTRVLEPLFDLNHVFGSVGDWYYLKGKRRRPTVLTAAAASSSVDQALLDRVDRFVVECPAMREDLARQGIESARIRMIFPPVDLERFAPAPPPDGLFTVLFASSPERSSWLEGRGVPLLLEAAALRPNIRFRLLWRPWGDSLATVRRWLEERNLDNVEIILGRFGDMASQYRLAHVTVAPFTRIEQCKPMPNSLLESLSCGRPVLVTPEVGLAEMTEGGRAGLTVSACGADLAEGIDRIKEDWDEFSENARRLAERWFCHRRFLDSYDRLYGELV
jgi:glycosyltransferase involved in cell wall biosynthesis